MTSRKKVVSLCETLLVILLIIECRGIWTRLASIGQKIDTGIYVGIAGICVIGCICQRRIAKKRFQALLFTITLLLLDGIIYVLISPYSVLGFFKFLFLSFLLIAFYFFVYNSEYSATDFLQKYESIVLLIVIESIFFWFFGSVVGWISISGEAYSTWTGDGSAALVKTFHGIYYETSYIQAYDVIRNSAIFTEPPMCAFHFTMAALIELFISKKTSVKKMIVFLIGIFSTVSTTGILVIIAAISLKYALYKNTKGEFNQIRNKLKIIGVPLIAVVATFLILLFWNEKIDSYSGIARVRDVIGGLNAWKTNIIAGAGYGNSEYISRFTGREAYSNGLIQLLAQGGLLLTLPFLLSIFNGIKSCLRTRNREYLAFIVCYFVLYSVTLVTYMYLSVFFFIICFELGRKNCGSKTLS